jgi:aspartate carbamoyltransferase catalytic subunit
MGRPKGVPNKLTRSVKEAFQRAFEELQEVEGVRLTDWAKDNTTEFYKIAAKLIPSEVNMTVAKAARDMSDDELANIAAGSGSRDHPAQTSPDEAPVVH